ncbi:type IV pilin protein [Pseudoalteromonas sp. SSM20]|uniref:type IV pilin protein n=1 Tax=Pseudoalteromonas sp. SSM20 TaxID=3139394 RepID=UPI003BAAF1B9
MQRQMGFTLVEIMIVVAIIGILTALALPAYTEYVKESRRVDAQQYLLQLSGTLERNYTRLGEYPTEDSITPETSDYYAYKYSRDSDTSFTLSASPKGAQSDDKCGDLSVNQQGATTASLDTCWR